MASDALADVARVRKEMQSEYGGKMSNQFVDEVKNSALFQFSWGELLSAAPTALTLMGSLWVAASSPIAEKISLAESMPTNGFEHLVKRRDPTLRSCLVDGKCLIQQIRGADCLIDVFSLQQWWSPGLYYCRG